MAELLEVIRTFGIVFHDRSAHTVTSEYQPLIPPQLYTLISFHKATKARVQTNQELLASHDGLTARIVCLFGLVEAELFCSMRPANRVLIVSDKRAAGSA